jgi:thiol-disulfide isomerase/thioredoxin
MRLLAAVAVVAVVVIGRRLYFQWRRRLATDAAPVPRLPAALLDGSERTWVVFTTPWCASCGPITADLEAADPTARVVTVDATEEPVLADTFRVRTAPTVLMAGADGTVQARFIGAEAVRDYVRNPA